MDKAAKQRERYATDPEYRERMRQKAHNYRWANLELVRAKDRARGFRLYDETKARARLAVTHAIERGKLTRQPCENCGDTPAHAHHDDYSKPLDVRWLCKRCHGVTHRRF